MKIQSRLPMVSQAPKKSAIPEPLPIFYGAPQTCEQAMENTVSWLQNDTISQKRATGVVTTASYQ